MFGHMWEEVILLRGLVAWSSLGFWSKPMGVSEFTDSVCAYSPATILGKLT